MRTRGEIIDEWNKGYEDEESKLFFEVLLDIRSLLEKLTTKD